MRDQSRVPEAVRWRVIYPLGKVFPNWCWTKLVSWAAYGFRDNLTDSRTEWPACKNGPDTIREGSCYCGKFQADD